LRRNNTVFTSASVPDYGSALAFGDKPKVPQAWYSVHQSVRIILRNET
jgi:hypothetical protein